MAEEIDSTKKIRCLISEVVDEHDLEGIVIIDSENKPPDENIPPV